MVTQRPRITRTCQVLFDNGDVLVLLMMMYTSIILYAYGSRFSELHTIYGPCAATVDLQPDEMS